VQPRPLGVIHSPFQRASGTPIQSRAAEGVKGTLEIFPQFVAGL
jgi:tRNA (Thr-GGU) A37 N-methylase